MAATQKISVKEFRMWLQGVEEMQEDGWIPNQTQWRKIREKIDQIDDTGSGVNAHPPISSPIVREGSFRPTAPMPPAVGASSLVTPPMPKPAATMANTPSGMPVAISQIPGASVKTPDIDTSSGSYVSQFT